MSSPRPSFDVSEATLGRPLTTDERSLLALEALRETWTVAFVQGMADYGAPLIAEHSGKPDAAERAARLEAEVAERRDRLGRQANDERSTKEQAAEGAGWTAGYNAARQAAMASFSEDPWARFHGRLMGRW